MKLGEVVMNEPRTLFAKCLKICTYLFNKLELGLEVNFLKEQGGKPHDAIKIFLEKEALQTRQLGQVNLQDQLRL